MKEKYLVGLIMKLQICLTSFSQEFLIPFPNIGHEFPIIMKLFCPFLFVTFPGICVPTAGSFVKYVKIYCIFSDLKHEDYDCSPRAIQWHVKPYIGQKSSSVFI